MLGPAEYLVKPVAKESLLAAVYKHLRRPADSPATILVVDDEPQAAQLASEVLESAGYSTVRVSSGQEALEVLERMGPDAILLDLIMPQMSGFELLHHIKKNPNWSAIPIFVLTAKDLTKNDLALLAQTEAVLPKASAWKDDLLAQISQILRKPSAYEKSSGR